MACELKGLWTVGLAGAAEHGRIHQKLEVKEDNEKVKHRTMSAMLDNLHLGKMTRVQSGTVTVSRPNRTRRRGTETLKEYQKKERHHEKI